MDVKLDEKKKEQLLFRVKEALDEDLLDITDWMKIYDILLEACERKSAAVYEEYLTESLRSEGELPQ